MRKIRDRVSKLERKIGADAIEVVIDDEPDKTLPVTAIEHGVTIYPRHDGETVDELLARMRSIPVREIRCLTVLRGGSTASL